MVTRRSSLVIHVYRDVPPDTLTDQTAPEAVVFGVRGNGEQYDLFWHWMRQQALYDLEVMSFSHDDFPWAYFAFRKPEHSDLLLNRWKPYCSEQALDDGEEDERAA